MWVKYKQDNQPKEEIICFRQKESDRWTDDGQTDHYWAPQSGELIIPYILIEYCLYLYMHAFKFNCKKQLTKMNMVYLQKKSCFDQASFHSIHSPRTLLLLLWTVLVEVTIFPNVHCCNSNIINYYAWCHFVTLYSKLMY